MGVAKAFNSDLRLIHVASPVIVASPMAVIPQSVYDELGVYEKSELERMAAAIDRPKGTVTTVVRIGGVYPELLAEATRMAGRSHHRGRAQALDGDLSPGLERRRHRAPRDLHGDGRAQRQEGQFALMRGRGGFAAPGRETPAEGKTYDCYRPFRLEEGDAARRALERVSGGIEPARLRVPRAADGSRTDRRRGLESPPRRMFRTSLLGRRTAAARTSGASPRRARRLHLGVRIRIGRASATTRKPAIASATTSSASANTCRSAKRANSCLSGSSSVS